jgi:two-component system, cell cycle sensor histidine kinase and response regulator CckA
LSQFEVQDDLWLCEVDKNQISQVVENFVINAQQAMPNGGTITVSAQNISLSANEHASLPAGKYVQLSIQDEGVGIPEDFLPRIFDPYYTTKPKGHGLGLTTCYSIITRHGGDIDVESEPGKGSTFNLYLPASVKSAETSGGKSTGKHAGQGTFLVMDDEEAIRLITKKMLESLGYTVVLKENGQGAVEFFETELKANRKVAGMIFDITIPGGMGGKEAIAEIRKLCSETPAFVASGYSTDPIMANPTEYGFTASIRKPYRMADLSEMLEKHLGK